MVRTQPGALRVRRAERKYALKTVLKVMLILVLALLVLAVGLVLFAVSEVRQGAVATVQAPENLTILAGSHDETLTVAETAPAAEAQNTGEVEDTADAAEADTAGEAEEADAEDVPYEEQLIYEVAQRDAEVINILLIGTDSRAGKTEATGRSDSMMLVSYDRADGKVRLVSLMRDSWVKINGNRWGRLNTAYNSGGPGALINTVNICFDLDVQYYAAIGFSVFEELIDKIGGVTVDLTKKEAQFINEKMKKRVLEPKDGPVLLDGEKALWYARCRADVDGDFSRTERQRHLMELLFESMRTDADLQKMTALASYAVENVTTNLTLDKMIELGTRVLTDDIALESYRLPFDGTWKHAEKNGGAVLSVDLEANAEALHAVLYGE